MAPLEIRVGERYETLWEEIRAAGYVRIRVDGQTYSLDQPPEIDRRRKHDVEVVIDRVTVRADARSRIAGSVENALSLGRGVLRVAYPRDDVPEPHWPVEIAQPAFRLRPVRAELRAALAAPLLVQQPAGLVPGLRRAGRADGHESGRAAARSEAHAGPGRRGALAEPRQPAVRARCWRLLRAARAFRSTCPSSELGGRHRRLIFHGTGEQWFDVIASQRSRKRRARRCSQTATAVRDPAVPLPIQGSLSRLGGGQPRVARRSAAKLEHLVDEVECTVCGGSRLRDDAAAVRLREPHDRRALPPAAGPAAGGVPGLEAIEHASGRSPAR